MTREEKVIPPDTAIVETTSGLFVPVPARQIALPHQVEVKDRSSQPASPSPQSHPIVIARR